MLACAPSSTGRLAVTRIPHASFKLVRILASGRYLDSSARNIFQIQGDVLIKPRRSARSCARSALGSTHPPHRVPMPAVRPAWSPLELVAVAQSLLAQVRSAPSSLPRLQARSKAPQTPGSRQATQVAAATLAHLRPLPEGGFVYRLNRGKTLQDGPKVGGSPDKPLLGAAATALQAWLDAAQLTEGAVLSRVGEAGGPGTERSRHCTDHPAPR